MDDNTATIACEVANEAAVVSVKNGRKSGLIICGVTVLTLGAAYGLYKLVGHIHRRKVAKKAIETAE